jgi:anaerobic magnesium-protoporphyrin IX monomethyl ester cyclase
MGAESGSQTILDAMDKGTCIEQIREAARLLKSAGIRASTYLQFGYPGETRTDIEKTLQLVREVNPDDIGVSVSYPMPGTKFFEAVRTQLGEKQNWQDSSDLAMLYHGTYSTAFYRKLHSVVHKEFRARKAWQALKDGFNLRSMVRLLFNLSTLPFARWKLDRLGAHPNPMLAVPHLPHEQAASPTPQE